jgi:hypothetical protein
MKPPLDQNPILIEIVEAELEPYRKVHSPEMVEYFRRELLAMMVTSPYTAALLRTLEPEPQVKESGEIGTEWDDEDEKEPGPAASGQGWGGRRG